MAIDELELLRLENIALKKTSRLFQEIIALQNTLIEKLLK